MKFLLCFLFSSSLFAQSYSYTSGGVNYSFYLQKNLVADFSGKSSSVKKALYKKSGVSIYKVTPSLYKKSLSSPQSSPVFSTNEKGGVLRALPGGVIVFFKKELSPSELEAWAQRYQVVLGDKLNIAHAWLIKTSSGLNALEVTQRLSSSEEVKILEPNWWIESSIK